MEKLGFQVQKQNVCPKSPSFKPLPFSEVRIPESSTLHSACLIGSEEKRSLKLKERRNKKISVLNFLQERRDVRNEELFGVQKKEKILIK